MLKYKYGALAGLWIVIGFTLLMPCVDNLSGAMILSIVALTIIGSSLLLSYSARHLLYKNMLAAAEVTFIGWLSLFFGIGHLFSPLFDNIGGPMVGQYLYFASGFFLVIFVFFCCIITLIIHKIRYRKGRKNL